MWQCSACSSTASSSLDKPTRNIKISLLAAVMPQGSGHRQQVWHEGEGNRSIRFDLRAIESIDAEVKSFHEGLFGRKAHCAKPHGLSADSSQPGTAPLQEYLGGAAEERIQSCTSSCESSWKKLSCTTCRPSDVRTRPHAHVALGFAYACELNLPWRATETGIC
jgi:hypothetical protein